MTTKKAVLELNKETGVIISDDSLQIQQDTWDGKDYVSVRLSFDEILKLAEEVKKVINAKESVSNA